MAALAQKPDHVLSWPNLVGDVGTTSFALPKTHPNASRTTENALQHPSQYLKVKSATSNTPRTIHTPQKTPREVAALAQNPDYILSLPNQTEDVVEGDTTTVGMVEDARLGNIQVSG